MLHSPALRFLSSDTSGGKDVEQSIEREWLEFAANGYDAHEVRHCVLAVCVFSSPWGGNFYTD